MKDFPWFKHYPEGTPHEINPDSYSSLLELFGECMNKFADLPAFENYGKSITYRELDELSTNFAAYLQNETNLKQGDRLAIQMPNLLQFPVAMFGAMKAGLILVNTNPLYTAKEMKHQFNDSGAKAIVIVSVFADKLEEILPDTGIETVILTDIPDMIGGVKGWIMDMVIKHVKKMVPKYSLPTAIPFNDVIKKGKQHAYTKPEVKNTDVAFLQYTGGTTGVSKGAMLTHRNIIANMEQLSAYVGSEMVERKELILTALPLYHIFALTVNCLAFMNVGGKNVLITNPRDIPAFIKEWKKHKVTVFTGVNTLFNGLMNDPSFKEIDFSTLKYSLGGGMAVQDVVARRWAEICGSPLVEAYGLSETAPGLTGNPINGKHRIGTIGIPIPSTEVMIADEDGNQVPFGERGEIWARGPQVMKGYWEKPEETANVFHEDWFKTGDIGVMEPDGFTKIVDRKKEMILVSGFNVYPNDVENAIAEHPKVLEVGVIGIPDERTTEAVLACVVKKDPSLTQEELVAHCKDNLTNYKVPKQVEFVEELPKSPVGKILRRVIREEYMAKQGETAEA